MSVSVAPYEFQPKQIELLLRILVFLRARRMHTYTRTHIRTYIHLTTPEAISDRIMDILFLMVLVESLCGACFQAKETLLHVTVNV